MRRERASQARAKKLKFLFQEAKVSKYLKIVVAALAVAALAAPAFADSTVSGYYRMQMMTDNLKGNPAKDKASESQIDQRLRMMYKNTLNEYVYFVYYAEIDTPWGQPSKGSIGGGGQAGADGVNVETKNAYLDFKIPNSIFSFRTGIQGFADRFEGTVINDDWAGVLANLAIAPTFNTTLGYFKGNENDTTKWDDKDLYAVQTNFKLSDSFSLMADGYWLSDNSTNLNTLPDATRTKANDLYILGVAANAKMAGMGLNAWLAYQFGTKDYDAAATGDQDYNALGGSAKLTMKAGPAAIGVRATAFSSNDKADKISWQGGIGVYEFPGENLSIFFADAYYNNTAGGRHAMTDAVQKGFGLFALNATADLALPGNLYLKSGAGYFMSLKDKVGADEREAKSLGFELAARVGTKVAEKVDVSLNGAYALVGDFYKAKGSSADPDNMYKVNMMVNVGF